MPVGGNTARAEGYVNESGIGAVHPSSDGLPPSAGGIYEGPTPGDQGNTGFWIALLFLSGTALLLLACFHRKKA